jgi:hypothetical protein
MEVKLEGGRWVFNLEHQIHFRKQRDLMRSVISQLKSQMPGEEKTLLKALAGIMRQTDVLILSPPGGPKSLIVDRMFSALGPKVVAEPQEFSLKLRDDLWSTLDQSRTPSRTPKLFVSSERPESHSGLESAILDRMTIITADGEAKLSEPGQIIDGPQTPPDATICSG